MTKHASDETRRKLIDLVFDKGFKLKDAANILDLKYNRAHKIISAFSNEGRIESKKPNRKTPIIYKEDTRKAIIDWFEANVDGTLEDCKKFIAENPDKFEKVPSISTIDRILREANITFKQLVPIPPQRNSPNTIVARKKYAAKYTRLETAGAHFVWLDEFGCNLSLRRRKGRSLKGSPATIEGPLARGNNLTVCAAIDNSGFLHYITHYGGFNDECFIRFISELKEKLNDDKRYVYICDNVAFHKSRNLKEFIKEKKFEFLYLAPYSPMLNPIEECFAKVKMIIAKELARKSGIMDSVKIATSSITSDNCKGWIKHSKEFFPQCFAERPIYNQPEYADSETSEEELFGSDDELVQYSPENCTFE